jgi:hypothetical protein
MCYRGDASTVTRQQIKVTASTIGQAAILCGGLGTRLGALTAAMPKPLLPVGERPFLEILLDELGRIGVNRIVLLAGFAANRIADYVATTPVKDRFGLSIEVAIEPFPAGTGAPYGMRENASRSSSFCSMEIPGSTFRSSVSAGGCCRSPQPSESQRCARSPMRRVMERLLSPTTGSRNSPSVRPGRARD